MTRSFFVLLSLSLIFLLSIGNAQDIDRKSKSALVKGILQKVFNLTLGSFANMPIKERKIMMVKLKEKLKKSAQFLGAKSKKYIKLIMDGVNSITSKNARANPDDIWDDSGNDDFDKTDNTHKQKGSTKTGREKRHKKKTASKLKSIANESLKNAQTTKERKSSLNNIQEKAQSKFQKYIKINKQDTALPNKDMVVQTVKRLIKNDAKLNRHNNNLNKNYSRRLEYEFVDKIDVNKDQNTENHSSKSIEVLEGSNKKDPLYKNVTLKLPCIKKNTIICSKIKALRIIKCSGRDMPIEKLCDGIDDCFDYSDEQDCAIQGIDKVRNATQIMANIEHSLLNHCYKAKIDDPLITKQNEILRRVLQSQLKFIQKHATATNSSHSNSRKFYTEPESVRITVNELAVVITTLSNALESTLCSNNIEEEYRKFNDIENIEKELENDLSITVPVTEKTVTWSQTSCKCIEEYCVGKCSVGCEKVCLQRYQISRWPCKAVSNKKSISLNLICDGKLDCYDEADENGCPIGLTKFEASNIYHKIFDMLTTKIKTVNFELVRNKLINLQILVQNLQKLTATRKVDVLEVKNARNECFTMMTNIYDQTRFYAEFMTIIDDMYMFLMSVNEKLVSAMKLSHIGNDRIIAPDGCFCRDNKCALPMCSELCQRSCPAEPKLTRYFCGGSMVMNQSIPIEAICNGKYDCPDKDDEQDCSEDICRRHHLVVLRHNLQEIPDVGTTVAEALKSWTVKVSATLRIVELNERPTPKVLNDIVHDMLHDLVMSYATLTSVRRRNNDNVMEQFYKTALVVMNSLRSCNK